MEPEGWYVEAILPSDDGYSEHPRMASRLYQVRAAAEEFAKLLRKTAKHPESVVVRTKYTRSVSQL